MATLILLAGGTGSRMGSAIPKQYLPLAHRPVALHSFELFQKVSEIVEIIVVCEPQYQHFFSPHKLFAKPGLRRQDSVYAGLLKSSSEMILTHDAARPLIQREYLSPLLQAANETGAAALAAPVSSTIKQCSPLRFVEKTLDRSSLWEIQTPQAVRRDLLLQAFDHAIKHNLTVTDELSLVEMIGVSAQIVPCASRNLKITTPFDLAVAEVLCATN